MKLRSSRGAVPGGALAPLTTPVTTLPTARLLLLLLLLPLAAFTFTSGDLLGLAAWVGGKEDSK